MAIERRIRVTHHEREDTAEKIRAAYTIGCLDDDELQERTGLAYTAKTRGDLADLVSDLPAILPREPTAGSAALSPRYDWSGWTRHALSQGCWLMLAAAGAWPIALVTRGIGAVPLIFLWFVSLRLGGLLADRGALRRHERSACGRYQ